jgi:phospholipid/cholesterol/gamma-HCH transport system substrate-binding protein
VEENLTERIDETPRAGDEVAAVDPAPSPRVGRLLAAGALALVLLGLLLIFLTRDDSYEYKLVFENAGQLVKGDLVRIGGSPVGDINAIELTDDGQAEVTVGIKEEFAPLHEGTTAVIRAQGLVGTANRYIDISPSPNFKPELADGARISGNDTKAIVELDQLFNTLNPKTRDGLDHVIQGFADWYAGQEKNGNKSAKYFSPAIVAGEKLFAELNRDSEVLQELLVESSKAFRQVSSRKADVTNLVTNTGETLDAVSSDTQSLREVLVNLPPALRQGQKTFASLRGPALDDLERFVVESEESARVLPGFLRKSRPVFRRSVPTFRQLAAMFKGPGAGNDLYDTLRDLPPLSRMADKSFPRAIESLRQSAPIFSFIRPYTPDLVSWLRNFGGAFAPYDASGHYARTMPVFDAYNFTDDADGGRLEPKSLAQRGNSPNLTTGQLRRCPGAAAPAPADGSAPFVDTGDLANADCDPSQRLGAP